MLHLKGPSRDGPVSSLCALLLLLFLAMNLAAAGLDFSEALLNRAERKYGKSGRERLALLGILLQSAKEDGEREKVRRVNDFFNRIPYQSDEANWKRPDYWATPVELLGVGGGDCEDYAIAKYFTLKALGVPEEKMRIMYVYAVRFNEPHMVMIYFPTLDAMPLVLDNMEQTLLPADQRKDLKPVYSFNGTGLWTAKEESTGKRVGDSERISLWTELMTRMDGPGP